MHEHVVVVLVDLELEMLLRFWNPNLKISSGVCVCEWESRGVCV